MGPSGCQWILTEAICSPASVRNGFLLSWYRAAESTWLLTMGNAILWSLCQHLLLPIGAARDVYLCTTFIYFCTSGSLASLSKICPITERHIDTDIVLHAWQNITTEVPWHLLPWNKPPPYELGEQLYSTVLCNLHNSLHVTFFPLSWIPPSDVLRCITQSCSQNKIKEPNFAIQGPLSFRTYPIAMPTMTAPAWYSLSLSLLHAFVYDVSAFYQTLAS